MVKKGGEGGGVSVFLTKSKKKTVFYASPNFPSVLYIGYFVWVTIMTDFLFESLRNPIRNHRHHPSLMMTSVVGGGKGVKQGIWQRRSGWAARWQYLGTLGNTCRGLIVPHTILFYKTKTKKDYKHKEKRQNKTKKKDKTEKKDKTKTNTLPRDTVQFLPKSRTN